MMYIVRGSSVKKAHTWDSTTTSDGSDNVMSSSKLEGYVVAPVSKWMQMVMLLNVIFSALMIIGVLLLVISLLVDLVKEFNYLQQKQDYSFGCHYFSLSCFLLSQQSTNLRKFGFHIEPFSYVIFKKGIRETTPSESRLLLPVKKRTRHVICRLCIPNGMHT